MMQIETGHDPGSFEDDLKRVREAFAEVLAAEELLRTSQDNLKLEVTKFNQTRRQRTLGLLKIKGKAICLMHREMIPNCKMGDQVVSKVSVSIRRVMRSLQQGGPHNSSEYDTTVCRTCASIVDRQSSFVTYKGVKYTMVHKPTVAKSAEELYTDEVLDLFSGYYNMPVVTLDTLESSL